MPTPFLVLDIETVLDPELPLAETDTERLPAPPHHRIVVIGALWFDPSYEVRRIGVVGDGKNERGILVDFANLMNERKPCLVTYNGRSFDLPVIAARCLGYGIPLVHYYRSRDVRYRFSPDGHLDLMDYVADFGAAKPSRLDVIAKLCGLPGKVGVDGKNVGPMVHAGRLAEVRDYCLCDVVQTAGVFLRVQLVRGELSHAAYREAMERLIRLIKADPRLGPVATGLDEPRLMLVEPSPPESAEAPGSSEAARNQ